MRSDPPAPKHDPLDRLTYLPPGERPILTWPGNSPVAFWLAVNIELRELMPGPNPSRVPWPRMAAPDVQEFSHHDYSNRVGLWRFVEVLADLAMPCTVSLNAGVLEHFPEIGAAIAERGWEIMGHGIYNTRYRYDLTEDEERREIEVCVELVRRHTGREIRGMLGPSISASPHTPDLLAEAGLVYHADWVHDDQPTEIAVRSGRLVSVPYSYDLNDAPVMRGHFEMEELADRVLEQIACLGEEGASSGRVVCLSVHPFLVGQPHRIDALAALLEHIKDQDVWWTTAGEIADHYLACTDALRSPDR